MRIRANKWSQFAVVSGGCSDINDSEEFERIELGLGGSPAVFHVLHVLFKAGVQNDPGQDVDAVDDDLVPSSRLVLGELVVDGIDASIIRESKGGSGAPSENDEGKVVQERADDAAAKDTDPRPEAPPSHAEIEKELEDDGHQDPENERTDERRDDEVVA